jgi:membrane protease YdiL (CAAX protease family)
MKKIIIYTLVFILTGLINELYFETNYLILFIELIIVSFLIKRKDVVFNNFIGSKKYNSLIFLLLLLTLLITVYSYFVIVNYFSLYQNIPFKFNWKSLFIIICFSIIEEVIFRGYFLGKLLVSKNIFKSILIVSVSFALTHMFSSTPILYGFILSLLISFIYLKSNSIILVILLHLSLNMFNYFFPTINYVKFFNGNEIYLFAINVILIFVSIFSLNHYSQNKTSCK